MSEQKDTGLRWLSVQAIHDHCHIDFNCEDAELEQMAEGRDTRLRSYQTLGLCAGAALAILLV